MTDSEFDNRIKEIKSNIFKRKKTNWIEYFCNDFWLEVFAPSLGFLIRKAPLIIVIYIAFHFIKKYW